MNEQQIPSSPSTYTLETITQRRLAKKAELRNSKEQIMEFSRELFAPQQSKTKFDNLMQQVNAGIAAYDGLMTGIKISNDYASSSAGKITPACRHPLQHKADKRKGRLPTRRPLFLR